ncbi:hypothetical protein GCM10029978_068290 [Actinoallomurus acanthiterrae]
MDNPSAAATHILQAVLNAEATTLRKVVAAVLDGHSTQVDVAQILDMDDAALAALVDTTNYARIRDDTQPSANTRRTHDRLDRADSRRLDEGSVSSRQGQPSNHYRACPNRR